jgi:hypothetical protein
MSGGGSSPTTVQQSGPPSWAVPYFQQYLGQAKGLSQQPYQQYGGETFAGMNQTQQQGLNAITQRAQSGSPINAAAGQELTNTLSGGYLNSGNPYMDSLVDKSQGDVIRGYQQSVIPQLDMISARSGSFGNSGMDQQALNAQRQLTSQLGDISTQIRGGAYENERNRMQGAVGMAPQIANQDYVDANALLNSGSFQQQQQQAGYDSNQARFNEARDGPLRQLGILGQALGGANYGNTSTSSGTPGSGGTGGAIQGALGGAAAGSALGPWGALGGGVLGGISGGK